MSKANVDKMLLSLVELVRVEMRSFTIDRKEHVLRAREEAEKNRDKVHSEWLVGGALYNKAMYNYNMYKDWLPGKPLRVEHMKVVALFKRCLRVSRDNIKQSVEALLAIDKDLYKAWSDTYGEN